MYLSRKNNSKKNVLFSTYECVLLLVSHILIIVSFVIAPIFGANRSILSTTASIIGVWGIITISKGSYYAHYIYIVFSMLYSILSITIGYYGEAIIYIFIMLPIHIFSVFSWKRNLVDNNSAEVKINIISKKHIIISFVVAAFLSVPFYYLLLLLKTEQIICSTLSLSTSALAAYLMLRHVKFFSVIFAIDDLFLLLLWGIQIITGRYEYVPTVIVCFTFLINDVYSAISWIKRSKKNNERQQKCLMNGTK